MGFSWQRMWHHWGTGKTQMGESKGEVSKGETLLGKHRQEWKLKQYSAQGALAFNEENEIYRRRFNPKTVSLDCHSDVT